MALTSYQRIANGDIDPESPVTTSLVTLLRDNPIAITVQSPSAPDMMLRRDPLVMNHGYGNNALVMNSTQDIEVPVIECASLSIEGGSGVTINFKRPVTIIRAIETITIDAIIDASGDIITGSGNAGGASGAGGGGGGAYRTTNSHYPEIGVTGSDGQDSQYGGIPGGAGGARPPIGQYWSQAYPGLPGVSMDSLKDLTLGQLLSYYSTGGGSGGSGGAGSSEYEWNYTGPQVLEPGKPGGAGGNGGGLLILIAPTIIFDSQCQIIMNGSNGSNGIHYNNSGYPGSGFYFGSGGGGGGGGGSLVAVTQGINSLINNALSTNFAGGAGGSRGNSYSNKYFGDGGVGGAGGNGGIYNLELERADEL